MILALSRLRENAHSLHLNARFANGDYCNGSGWSKSAETICYDVQQELKKMAHMLEEGNHHPAESGSRKGAEERRIRFNS
jgi:hypothetical protein